VIEHVARSFGCSPGFLVLKLRIRGARIRGLLVAIAQVVKKEAQDAPKLSYCVLLEKANAPSGEISQEEKKKAN